jgi:1-aminocyclopropane-1-carboxylate deaminase/D-cysteine desulfhydrase-like pyridoxal-dependent ACC family enzyme
MLDLEAFPRVELASFPTPLEPLPRLSERIGRAIYVKRDDVAGGNKIRSLEFLVAQAEHARATTLVTFGGLQSNHARLTAAVARERGLEAHLLYFERRPAALEGNPLVAENLGAHLHFVPFGRTERPTLTIEAANRLARLIAYALVGRHWFIPVGGSSWLGCLGYVRAAAELSKQAQALGIKRARVVVPVGTGGTLAGLLAGLSLFDSSLRVLGIDVGNLWRRFARSIARTATEVCRRLGSGRAFTPADVPLVERRYAGDGYARPSAEASAAAELLADLEGLPLDPVYTAKSFAGLLDLAARGELGGSEPIVFLHTGGVF